MDIYIDCKFYNENDAAEGWEVYYFFTLVFTLGLNIVIASIESILVLQLILKA